MKPEFLNDWIKEGNEFKTNFSFNGKVYSLSTSYIFESLEMKIKDKENVFPSLCINHREINKENFLEIGINYLMKLLESKKDFFEDLKNYYLG